VNGGAARRWRYPDNGFPALAAKHVENAKFFADRKDLIASLPLAPGATIAEIGVAQGEFTEFLLATLQPATFVAFDTFNWHDNHLENYQRRFADCGHRVLTEVGLSQVTLAKYPDDTFDMIYIDARHDFASVEQDAILAMQRIKLDGFLIFNDYIMFDHLAGEPYGVVQVVNNIIVREDLRVYGFALERQMFCDIAFQR